MLVRPKQKGGKMGRSCDTGEYILQGDLLPWICCSFSCTLGLLSHSPGSHISQRPEPGTIGPAAGERQWCSVASTGNENLEHQGGVWRTRCCVQWVGSDWLKLSVSS